MVRKKLKIRYVGRRIKIHYCSKKIKNKGVRINNESSETKKRKKKNNGQFKDKLRIYE